MNIEKVAVEKLQAAAYNPRKALQPGDAEYEKLKGLEVVVLGCLRMTEHHSHQKFQEAMEMAKRINAKQTFFTHMCHHIGLHSEIEDLVPENIMFAYDGLSIAFE
jgi:phosphoribosyl 1,2-cyclic phosphate phosphodiesterase